MTARRFVVVTPDRELTIVDAPGDNDQDMLRALQKAVGGYIEPLLTHHSDYVFYLNEDGFGLPNVPAMVFLLKLGYVPGSIPVGPLVICGRQGNAEVGLTNEQIAVLREIRADMSRDQSTGADWRP